MKQLLLLLSLLSISVSNLVRGGDFQYYSGPFTYTSLSYWASKTSQRQIWYNMNMENIQFVGLIAIQTTVCMDLSSYTPYTLCQDIQLTAGTKYELNYSFYSIRCFEKLIVTAYINSINVSSLQAGTSQFVNQTNYFIANVSGNNQLCFNQVRFLFPAFRGNDFYGALLDNISVIEGDLIIINVVDTIIQQKNSSITLVSNFTYVEKIVKQIKVMYMQSVGKRFSVCEFIARQDGFLSIYIQSDFNFQLKQLSFTSIGNLSAHPLLDLKINILNPDQHFHCLSSFQRKILTVLDNGLQFVNNAVNDITLVLRFMFCTYYVLTLISFQSLTLFYAFLNIKTVPVFTKTIYQKLLHKSFQLIGLPSLVQQVFNLSYNPFTPKFQVQNVVETMLNQKNGQNWFGYYGLSSLFFKNNLDNLLMLGLLLLKIAFLVIALKVINKFKFFLCLRKHIKIRYLMIAFMVQFIILSPTFIISALARIQSSNYKFIDAVQKMVQSLTLFICLFLIFIYFMEQIRQNRPLKRITTKKIEQKISVKRQKLYNEPCNKISQSSKQKQKPLNKKQIFGKAQPPKIQEIENKQQIRLQYKNNKNNKKLQPGCKKQLQNNTGNLIICFTIPFFISIFDQPKLFFTINSLAFVIKIICYIKNCSTKHKLHKILQFFVNIAWICQHTTFILFYIIQQKYDNLNNMSQSDQKYLVILGFTAICTLLFGCCLTAQIFVEAEYCTLIKSLKSIIWKELLISKLQKVVKPQVQLKIDSMSIGKILTKWRIQKLSGKSQIKEQIQILDLQNLSKNQGNSEEIKILQRFINKEETTIKDKRHQYLKNYLSELPKESAVYVLRYLYLYFLIFFIYIFSNLG